MGLTWTSNFLGPWSLGAEMSPHAFSGRRFLLDSVGDRMTREEIPTSVPPRPGHHPSAVHNDEPLPALGPAEDRTPSVPRQLRVVSRMFRGPIEAATPSCVECPSSETRLENRLRKRYSTLSLDVRCIIKIARCKRGCMSDQQALSTSHPGSLPHHA